MTKKRSSWTSSSEHLIAGRPHTEAEVPVSEEEVFALNVSDDWSAD